MRDVRLGQFQRERTSHHAKQGKQLRVSGDEWTCHLTEKAITEARIFWSRDMVVRICSIPAKREADPNLDAPPAGRVTSPQQERDTTVCLKP
jgi:hypothetical protein